MYVNADCTIFNKYTDKSRRCDAWKRTVIHDVYWEDTSGEKTLQSGLSADCSAFVVIPKTSVNTADYQKPKDFNKNPAGFTFAPDDIIVRGIITADLPTLSEINALDDSHTILKASDFIYGSPSVQHWEVQAK